MKPDRLGGAVARGTPRHHGDAGAQAVEFAMTLPAVVMVLLLVVWAGVVATDLVAAQGLAREGARAAAVGEPAEVAARIRATAGGRPVEVSLTPSAPRTGDIVRVRVRLQTRRIGPLIPPVWVAAEAAMRVEAP